MPVGLPFSAASASSCVTIAIGVLVFLTLCIIGLLTVYLKVAKLKTFYYLIRVNGLTWYILLIVFGFINWDVFITNYNINNRDKIALDVEHLMELSDKTLPILDKNRSLLNTYAAKSNHYNYTATDSAASIVIDTATTIETNQVEIPKPPVDSVKIQKELKQNRMEAFNQDLDLRIERFKEEQERISWLSWNWPDWQTTPSGRE